MLDSGIYIGSTGDPQGFSSPGIINPNVRVMSVIIRGEGDLPFGFENSFISGGRIDFVRVTNPAFLNGDAFGISGAQIDRVDVISPELVRGFTSPNEGVVVMDDFEIRPGFQAPV